MATQALSLIPGIDEPEAQSAPRSPLHSIETDVVSLRDAVFTLADTARETVPHDMTQLHVSLQIVANELGRVERLLSDARPTESPGVALSF